MHLFCCWLMNRQVTSRCIACYVRYACCVGVNRNKHGCAVPFCPHVSADVLYFPLSCVLTGLAVLQNVNPVVFWLSSFHWAQTIMPQLTVINADSAAPTPGDYNLKRWTGIIARRKGKKRSPSSEIKVEVDRHACQKGPPLHFPPQ